MKKIKPNITPITTPKVISPSHGEPATYAIIIAKIMINGIKIDMAKQT